MADVMSGKEAIARNGNLDVVQHTETVEQTAEADERRVWCIRVACAPNLRIRVGGRRRGGNLQRDQQNRRRMTREVDAVLPVHAVLVEQRHAARVHVFDAGNVDAIRAGSAPCGLRLRSKAAHAVQSGRPGGERHQRQAGRRPGRQHAQRDLGDDAQGPLGADQQIDEVHLRGGEITGRQLGQRGHPIPRHRHTHHAVAQFQIEVTVGVSADFSSMDVEHVARRQHDRQRLDPVARGAVLERRGARGVGGDDAPHAGATEGWRGRIVRAPAFKRRIEHRERDAWFDANPSVAELEDAIQPGRAEDDFAHRCGAAGQRRLGADGQDGVGVHEKGRDLGFVGWRRESSRVTTGKMRGVLEHRRDHVGVAADAGTLQFPPWVPRAYGVRGHSDRRVQRGSQAAATSKTEL
jgi:hypothetical protein